MQNGIVWFWPNTDLQYKDILTEKKPPYIPELEDPSYIGTTFFTRDIPYGYEHERNSNPFILCLEFFDSSLTLLFYFYFFLQFILV
ncbi:hypothetical protein Hanom_Chr14g01268981 [Helianthus anomalus]